MANSSIKLGRTIIWNADEAAQKFIEQWFNGYPYIDAHTSGSTGKPKIISLLKSDMQLSAQATCQKFSVGKQSKMVMPLSANYIAGKMMIVRAIVSEAELWIEEPSNNPIIQDYGTIDLIPIVPSQINSLLTSKYKHNIRNIIIGGGAIPPTTEHKCLNANLNAYATYGMTETCSHVAIRKIGSSQYEAMPGVYFSNDDRNCLIINAPKYSYKNIVTNDIVKLVDSTHFEWIGRWDNVINTGGIKVFPEHIERQISDIISEPFYIIGTPDEKWGECVTLYIENPGANIQDLKNNIDSRLCDKYERPTKIVAVAEFKRTYSGKIKREAL